MRSEQTTGCCCLFRNGKVGLTTEGGGQYKVCVHTTIIKGEQYDASGRVTICINKNTRGKYTDTSTSEHNDLFEQNLCDMCRQ